MMIAAVVITPFGAAAAWAAVTRPGLLLAAVGVGICSSVIPYVTDQLAMARLPRATFALLLALLPAMATIVGLVVLRQIPTMADLAGVGLVVAGVAVHQDAPAGPGRPGRKTRQNICGGPRRRRGARKTRRPAGPAGRESRRGGPDQE